jgi:hypothetical protein
MKTEIGTNLRILKYMMTYYILSMQDLSRLVTGMFARLSRLVTGMFEDE